MGSMNPFSFHEEQSRRIKRPLRHEGRKVAYMVEFFLISIYTACRKP